MDYTILKTRANVDPATGVQGRINFIFWSVTKTDESVRATLFSRGTPVPADYLPADKPYAEVTEQDCIDWVIDLEDQAGIEAQLDEKIDQIENPTEASGAPWQEAFPLWATGVAVAIGDVRIYEGFGYECVQAHTTQATWAPPVTPALWKQYVDPSQGPQPWVQPTGAQDAYPIGAQVTHVGNLWSSLVDANVWEPSAAVPTLWQDEGAYP